MKKYIKQGWIKTYKINNSRDNAIHWMKNNYTCDDVFDWMKQYMTKLRCDCLNKIIDDWIIWKLMKLIIQLTMWLTEWSNTWQSEGATTWIKKRTIWFALWLY